MLPTVRLLAVSTFMIAGMNAALAEAPSCPGGGTATGKISCTGPIFKPVCTEGPPWTCTLKDDKTATVEMGDGGGRPTRPQHVFESLSGNNGGVFDPGTGGDGGTGGGSGGGGGGGGGPGGHLGDVVGPMPTMVSDGGSGGPSIL